MGIKSISNVSRNNYIKDLIKAIEQELKITYSDLKSVDTALMFIAGNEECLTWENFFGLELQPNWTLEDRRNRLIYTFNSKGFFTKKFLKNLALVFTNGEISIDENYEEYHFIVQFTSIIGQPPNINNFTQMVEINKPAHLTWELRYRFRTHGELRQFKHEILKKYTHEELRNINQITR